MLKRTTHRYFAALYARTMSEAYTYSYGLIDQALTAGGDCLDCGAGSGHHANRIRPGDGPHSHRYFGMEWDYDSAHGAADRGLAIVQGDLNAALPFPDGQFHCVFALSVLEHLVMGCHFIQEAHRILRPGGRLIILTPNISAWFNIALLTFGKMPSSGPHPDSAILLGEETPVRFRAFADRYVEDQMPTDRHLVVFSYRVLRKYLELCGFQDIIGRGFGLYPFPAFLQPHLERIDPWHCHQMVFSATR